MLLSEENPSTDFGNGVLNEVPRGEVIEAVKKMKNGKAVGTGEVVPPSIKTQESVDEAMKR